MKYPLAKNGVFWTLQGEGALQGEPMAFVRLAGCSVGCVECDTDYRASRRVEIEDLIREIQQAVPTGFKWPWIWITGGEPSDHNIAPVVDALRTVGYRVALATAGVRAVPVADWISVSPHSLNVQQRFGHELKVVPGLNGLSWADLDVIDCDWHSFPWRFVQPIWYQTVNGPEKDGAASRESLERCVEFVKTHPGWRLTIQAHKYWRLP